MNFLETLHPTEKPYYEPSYLELVTESHKKFEMINANIPILFIITRNQQAEITNLTKSLHNIDGIRDVSVIAFDSP